MVGTLVIGAWTVLVLIYTWRWLSLPDKALLVPSTGPLPLVTVVVAMRNEATQAGALVEAVLGQHYPALRLIVVDDGSTDDTLAKLQPYADAGRLTLLRATGEGKKAALAQGAVAAEGDYLLFTDADCRMGPDWVACHVASLRQSGAAMSVGAVRTVGGNRLQRLETVSLQAVTGGSVMCGRAVMCSGANLAVRRADYLDCIGELEGDTASGDDMFLLAALKRRHARIAFASQPGSVVETSAPLGWRAFMAQRARWAGKARKYTDFDTLAVGLLMLLVQVVLLYDTLRGLLPAFLWWTAAGFPLMSAAAGFLGQRSDLWLYPLAALLYPFYVLFVLIRLIWPVQWKERTIA